MLSKLGLSFVLFFLVSGHAGAQVVLDPIAIPTITVLPIDTTAAPYTCDQVLAKLQAYQSMATQHNQSVNSFFGQVVQKVGSWYNLLSPLEGTSQTLATGTFSPIHDGSMAIGNVSSMVMQNSVLLANEVDRLVRSLAACTLTPVTN